MRSTARSRRWLPGGGSHHPFLYRPAVDVYLTEVDTLVASLREVIDLTAEEQQPAPAPTTRRRREVVDPFALARR